jgi:hypothetical protein
LTVVSSAYGISIPLIILNNFSPVPDTMFTPVFSAASLRNLTSLYIPYVVFSTIVPPPYFYKNIIKFNRLLWL